MKLNISKIAFIIALPFCHLLLGQELVDGIAAIVGDEIILYTEVLQTSQIYALQMNINPLNQVQEYNQLKQEMLKNLINDKILLAKAIEDTITVTDQQIETALDERIQGLVQELGSEKEVEAYFGISIRQIKKNYREDIRKLLIIETVKQQKSKDVKISRAEVEDYFNTKKDSLPQKKAVVKARHILMKVQPGGLNRQIAMQKIQEIQERLSRGEDFSELARFYSEDPGTANIGGDLGFIEKGTLFESFEDAGFQLERGQISEIVETPIGFHLIQMVDKQEDKAHMKHILIRINITQQDESGVIDTLIYIRNKALSGEDFGKLAYEYSQDESSKQLEGDLGWLPVEDLEIPIFKSVVDTLQAGHISLPFQTEYGYHLVKVEDREEARKYSLEEDWDEIKTAALNTKILLVLNQWIEELKKDMYIVINKDIL